MKKYKINKPRCSAVYRGAISALRDIIQSSHRDAYWAYCYKISLHVACHPCRVFSSLPVGRTSGAPTHSLSVSKSAPCARRLVWRKPQLTGRKKDWAIAQETLVCSGVQRLCQKPCTAEMSVQSIGSAPPLPHYPSSVACTTKPQGGSAAARG